MRVVANVVILVSLLLVRITGPEVARNE